MYQQGASMYAIMDSGVEIERHSSREDAEQGIALLLLAGRWHEYVVRLADVPAWVERVSL